jgi:hypothetical protein
MVGYWYFGRPRCLHLQGEVEEDGKGGIKIGRAVILVVEREQDNILDQATTGINRAARSAVLTDNEQNVFLPPGPTRMSKGARWCTRLGCYKKYKWEEVTFP